MEHLSQSVIATLHLYSHLRDFAPILFQEGSDSED